MSGSLFVVAAPSGAGKTSLVKALVNIAPKVHLSISHTTRPPRESEIHGQDYFFVNREVFAQMYETGAFLESATVFDNSYGTLSAAVMNKLDIGVDVILEIDWQGAQQIRRNYPDCVGVFVLPPSKRALEQRLRDRGEDNDAVIDRRMRDAVSEMSHYSEFEYVIVNDDFDEALDNLMAVITARRHSLFIQKQAQAKLLRELLA